MATYLKPERSDFRPRVPSRLVWICAVLSGACAAFAWVSTGRPIASAIPTGISKAYGGGRLMMIDPEIGATTDSGLSDEPSPTMQRVGIARGSQGADCEPTVPPAATVASNLNSVFASNMGPGWLGGDGTYSTKLPTGAEAFVFSDTLIGIAQQSGAAFITGMVHNSELVGTAQRLSSDSGYGSPQSLIPDASGGADRWWWTASTYIEHGGQLIYVNEFTSVPGSTFGQFTGRSGIAVLSLSANAIPSYSSITLLPTDTATQWGNAILQDASYTYVYGLDSDPSSSAFSGMKLARVPRGHSLNTNSWTYWNGTQWIAGESNAIPVMTGSALTGVSERADGAGYVAVSIPAGVLRDTTVDLSYACSPAGPWSTPQPVYSIPQISEYSDEVAYTPTFHPELANQGGLVVSYNINNASGASDEQNVHQYQPQFLLLNN